MHHFIGKQTIEIRQVSRSEAFQWQQRLSNMYWNRIVPELEQLFDRLSDENERVVIDKLEIDLGGLSEKEIVSGDWIKKMIGRLEEAVRKAKVERVSPHGQLGGRLGTFNKWVYFLKYGQISYYESALQGNWQQQVLDMLGLNVRAADQLRQLLAADSEALDRLMLQHSADFLVAVLELFSAKQQKELGKAAAELKELWNYFLNKRLTKKQKTKVVEIFGHISFLEKENLGSNIGLKKLIEKNKNRTVRELEIIFWKNIYGLLFKKGIKSEAKGYLKLIFNEIKILNELVFIFEKQLEIKQFNYPVLKPVFKEIIEKKKFLKKNYEKTTAPDKDYFLKNSLEGREYQKAAEKASIVKEGIYVPNAGAVILYPYLKRFLGNIGLLENETFSDEWHQQKAAKMIHYLSSGEALPEVFHMALSKLLCGLPVDIPIDTAMPLSDDEKGAAHELLEVVIEHWGALGSTSPEGLREGFLQRDGKLSRKNNGWLLQVERKTLDILLDQIPWGFGVIKYPWMEELLFVEWN